MDLALATIIGGVLLLLGLIGCVVPVIPGPLCAYAALWVLVAFGATPGSTPLIVGAVVLILATIADYVFPAIFAQKFKCSKMGAVGCFVGTVVGLFFLPLGLVAGPFLGTVCGELIVGRTMGAALKGGVGSLVGFVVCLVLKFAAVAACAYWFVVRIISGEVISKPHPTGRGGRPHITRGEAELAKQVARGVPPAIGVQRKCVGW